MHKLVMVSSVFLGLTAIPSYADRVTIGGLRFQPQILCATTSENAAGGCRSERGLPRVGPEGAPTRSEPRITAHIRHNTGQTRCHGFKKRHGCSFTERSEEKNIHDPVEKVRIFPEPRNDNTGRKAKL